MKKIITLMLALLVLLNVATAFTYSTPAADDNVSRSYTIDNPLVKVTQITYEPYPAQPGSYIEVWLKVENLGDEEAETVTVRILDQGPFSGFGERTKTIGKLLPRQAAVMKFNNVKIDANAGEGTNYLYVETSAGGAYDQNPVTTKLPIEIESVAPILSLDVSSDPEKIPQGGVATLKVEVENADTAALSDIMVKLNLPPSALAPIGSTSQKKIQQLNPGDKAVLEFEIMALSEAASNIYSVPIHINFRDQTGAQRNINDTAGILIDSVPELYVTVEDSDAFTSGKKGNVVLSISNVGPSDIKYLTVGLESTDDYIVLSNNKEYIGNMESDDFETSEFEIYVKKVGDIPLKAVLEYKDSFNNEATETFDLELKSYNSKELMTYGLVPAAKSPVTILIYLVLIIYVYLFYKHWKREKNFEIALKEGLRSLLKGFFALLGQLRWRNLKRIPKRIKIFISQ